MEPIVAYFHYLGAIGIGSVLASEFFLFKREMTHLEAKVLQRVDLAYLIFALIMLGTGFSRAYWYAKGHEYYFSNWIFNVKLVTFIIVGFVSILPTVSYMKWNSSIKEKKTIQVGPKEFNKIRLCILMQLILFPLIPLTAVLMSRGFGAHY